VSGLTAHLHLLLFYIKFSRRRRKRDFITFGVTKCRAVPR